MNQAPRVYSNRPPSVMVMDPNSSESCCSPCRWCGHHVSWQQSVTSYGGLFCSTSAIALPVIAYFCWPSLLPHFLLGGGIATTGSCIIHEFAGVTMCCWKPHHDFEEVVEGAGDVVQSVDIELQSLQTTISEGRALTSQQRQVFDDTLRIYDTQKREVEQKTKTIKELSKEIRELQRQIDQSQPLFQSFPGLIQEMTKKIRQFHPCELSRGIEQITQDLKQLSLVKKETKQTTHALSKDARIMQETAQAWQSMIDEFTRLLGELQQISLQKEKQLSQAQEQFDFLKGSTTDVHALTQKLEEAKQEILQLRTQLQSFEPILQDARIQSIMRDSQKK